MIKPNSGIRAWTDFGVLEVQIVIAFERVIGGYCELKTSRRCLIKNERLQAVENNLQLRSNARFGLKIVILPDRQYIASR